MPLHFLPAPTSLATLLAPNTRRTLAKVRHGDSLYDHDICETGVVALYHIYDPAGEAKVIDDMEIPVSVVLQMAAQYAALGIHTVADALAWEQAIGARASALWDRKVAVLPVRGVVG